MIINLVRTSGGNEGTFGRLIVLGEEFAVTAEPPWKNNRQSVSCIPTGEYKCEKVNSPKFGNVYHIKDVPGRTYILIHAGNFSGDKDAGLRSDTYGCILIGTDLGEIHNQKVILTSKFKLDRFHKIMNNESFTLIISELSDIN